MRKFRQISCIRGFMILTMLSVGALFGLVWLLTGMSYEYEYILTNDDLDIDKITGKRKRKRLITLKMNTVEEFGIYDGTNGANADATVSFRRNEHKRLLSHCKA